MIYAIKKSEQEFVDTQNKDSATHFQEHTMRKIKNLL